MEHFVLLIIIGFMVGTLGTLIGAGGGFILVPILLLTNPALKPEIITAVSMAIVALNALSGTVAYAKAKRIDYKAGILFALFTIPGSIIGALTTKHISKNLFNILFGVILLLLAIYLFFKKASNLPTLENNKTKKSWRHHLVTDSSGKTYSYSYNNNLGLIISLLVGFISPILGIGGGIIHVPALVNWLKFPVHIATATSHFILLIMAVASVFVHIHEGSYNDPAIVRIIILLGIGVICGAQLGAYLSQKIKGQLIIRALALALGLVGLRILLLTI
ncbi:MAG: sulfite exporter TauE/SafE family protein [Chitinophagaceae bacterium]